MRGFILAALIALSTPAVARDGYDVNGRPLVCDPQQFSEQGLKLCRAWVSSVKQPNLAQSCCGDGDAFIADAYTEHDGGYYAVITEEYPAITQDDGEGSTVTLPGMKKGTEVLIPPGKFNPANLPLDQGGGGNPSGHGVVYLGSGGVVLCYFGPSLT